MYPISGGSDVAIDDPPTPTPTPDPPPPPAPDPVPPQAETAEQRVARLELENARLVGENSALRTRPTPEPAAPAPKPAADPIAAEYAEIQRAFTAGEFTEDERIFRIGKLGAKAEHARIASEQREIEARQRDDAAKQRSSQKIAAYIARRPGLRNADSPEMQHVGLHLKAVTEELNLALDDPRAQALALERAFGPINGGPPVDTREFERRRQPGGGGGGSYSDEPTPPPKPKSKGQDIFERLLPEFQEFFVSFRGSKDAAIKSLEHADETQMRRMGRFR